MIVAVGVVVYIVVMTMVFILFFSPGPSLRELEQRVSELERGFGIR